MGGSGRLTVALLLLLPLTSCLEIEPCDSDPEPARGVARSNDRPARETEAGSSRERPPCRPRPRQQPTPPVVPAFQPRRLRIPVLGHYGYIISHQVVDVSTQEQLTRLLAPHRLQLQVGCPIILLRNMTGGLANGTRLIVARLTDRLIEARVVTGPSAGKTVFIPRLNITPSDVEGLPFTLRRRQFPVRPAFCMTVNKAQGQTLQSVGLYLPKPVFSHGQLYVALSRVGSPAAAKVLVVGGWHDGSPGVPAGVYTRNVVYREVFEGAAA